MMFQTYGNRNHPAVLFFHAMGVTGESSEPVANYLQDRYFCILPTSTVYCKGQKCNRCNTARPVPRPRRHRRGPPRSLQGAKAPYIWPASFCNTSRQSCSHGFQRLSPVPLDGAAGHSCIACPVPKAAAFQRMFPSHADASFPGSSQRLHGTVPACKNGQTGSASRNHQG